MKRFTLILMLLALPVFSAQAGMSLNGCVGLLGSGVSGLVLCSKIKSFDKSRGTGEVFIAVVNQGGGVSCTPSKVSVFLHEGEGVGVTFSLRSQDITLIGSPSEGTFEVKGMGATHGTYRAWDDEELRQRALRACVE